MCVRTRGEDAEDMDGADTEAKDLKDGRWDRLPRAALSRDRASEAAPVGQSSFVAVSKGEGMQEGVWGEDVRGKESGRMAVSSGSVVRGHEGSSLESLP